MHPLAPNLTELKDDELRQKQADLMNKLSQAYRFGNGALVQQIQMLLADYNAEIGRRQQQQLDDMLSKNGKLDKLINVK